MTLAKEPEGWPTLLTIFLRPGTTHLRGGQFLHSTASPALSVQETPWVGGSEKGLWPWGLPPTQNHLHVHVGGGMLVELVLQICTCPARTEFLTEAGMKMDCGA